MSYRLLASMMSLCLLSCAGSTQVRETVSRPRVATSLAESKPWPTEALKAAKSAKTTPTESEPEPQRIAKREPQRIAKPEPQRIAKPEPQRSAKPEPQRIAKTEPQRSAKPEPQPIAKPEPQRIAKASKPELEDEEASDDFSGVDTSAPVDSDTDDGPREVVIEGIKGTTSEFDVRTTLDGRFEDFDRCHDRMGGGGGRIAYRIHIDANGDVGGVKVHTMRSRNRKLVDCYTEVISSSHFPRPHGGYADVKWTTKVGRSGKRPNSEFTRPHRWDTPAGSRAAR